MQLKCDNPKCGKMFTVTHAFLQRPITAPLKNYCESCAKELFNA